MTFSEERLDLGYDYGTVATITTKTTIIELKNGSEQRTVNWYQPLLRFEIDERTETNQELENFVAFHQARKGSFEGFRFKDWSDYQFNTVITLNEDLQAQLFKTYTAGGSSVKRPLIKIVNGTVSVSVGNSPLTSGWTVDYNTGVITFEEEPDGTIRVAGEFDVPVRFEDDRLNWRFFAYEVETGRKIFNWENLSLTEVRILPTIPLTLDTVPQGLSHTINLGYDYGTVGGNEFATDISRLASGQERRTSDWTSVRGTWDIGTRTLLKSDLDYLIALFRVCRGKAVPFSYFDWVTESEKRVRFGEDAIAFRFDAYEQGTGRVIFNLSGVPLIVTTAPQPDALPPLSNTGYGTGWDRPVSNNTYGWSGAGDSVSKWLTYPPPAPTISSSENFDWVVSYSFTSPGFYALRARFMCDNQLLSVKINGVTVLTGPIGGFPFWTNIEFFVPMGAIVISFTVRNVTEGATLGFLSFNPTGFRLEWLY